MNHIIVEFRVEFVPKTLIWTTLWRITVLHFTVKIDGTAC